MAKTRRVKDDDEERVMKENIRKGFQRMFAGKGEPLSNMSIQEVEALKARVASLEAELAQKPASSKESPVSSTSQAETRAGMHRPLSEEFSRPQHTPAMEKGVVEGRNKSFFDHILDFFRLPEDKDPDFIRLVRNILIFTLFANIGVLFLTLGVVNERIIISTVVTLSILLVLVVVSLFFSFRKKILPAKIIVPVALIIAVTYIAQGANGLHDSAIAGYGLTIVIASLILGNRGTLFVSGLAVIGVLYVGYSDMAGLTASAMAAKTGYDDILIIAVLLVTSGGMLRLLVKRLSESTLQAIRANKELQAFQIGLEQRIADRTHDLELAVEVGQIVSANVNDLNQLLAGAVELIRSRFNLYYTQIYLADPSEKMMALRAGTGEVGKELLQRGHHLPIDSGSLNGRAAYEKHPVIVSDTQESPIFLPNRLLPHTRSEMSIPLLVGGKVVGVLDMQSEQPGALNEFNLPAFQALAGQLAIAVQNAALFKQVEESRAEVETQVQRLTEHGWQEFLNAIDRGQKLGFAFEESKVTRLDSEALATESEAAAISIPISITGTTVGEIHLPVEANRPWTANEIELIKATSTQLAQHIDNLRLLAQADQYRAQAEEAVRRLTRESWDAYLQTYKETEPGYLYDLTEVKQLSEKGDGSDLPSIKYPVLVQDETIGELAVETLHRSEDVDEVLAAVTEQLSSHLENLRLSRLTEIRAQREHTLRQITTALRSSTNPATIMRTAVREIGSILGRKAIVQLANPEQAGSTEPTLNGQNQPSAPAYQS